MVNAHKGNEMRKAIESEHRDSDGYWIHLRRGFKCHGDHSIVEDTKRAAMEKLRDVVPCACSDCHQA